MGAKGKTNDGRSSDLSPINSVDGVSSLHDQLVIRAGKWLENNGCKVVIRDPFRSNNQEQPDAIGWRDGVSILVEVKTSRADFLADRKKPFREEPGQGMGDWRFYLTPPNLVSVNDLPIGWGLLEATPKTIKKAHGYPVHRNWIKAPFSGDKGRETILLSQALRRLALRGYLPEIYLPRPDPDKTVVRS